MPTDFNNFFIPLDVRLRELPLVHSTGSEVMDNLGRDGSLDPQDCPVFLGERLTYLFYGRPCFKPPESDLPDATTRMDVAPVCFVFRPSVTQLCVRRLFPCDTGAIHYRKFTGFIEQDELAQFEMDAREEMAVKLVGFFYDSNQAYFDNAAPRNVDLAAAPESVVKYFNLLSHEGDTSFDERRSALEFQSCSSIPLRGNVLAVILPFSLLQRPEIQRRIVEDWHSTPIGYNARRGSSPHEFYAKLKDAVQSTLRMGGYL
jgi:hypothetical protein